ncbi:uncharacterized protein ACA1_132430 [Acanthamoeba castellanii str. Neff]|uniref:PAS domain-containing protein n=1 Tax=Acanthamoeba castellanii (strain ATCC 30010 / Neff) TaxID=1257118 RepID=L8GVI3_ACACF|nr:uncharacterized protein ACA1_132430 [Acanthamoeba castellanii str. Neff]ELR17030.1 hypothetical protein ACA1_132430 [Acanthamoeba castellanii str. Neff]
MVLLAANGLNVASHVALEGLFRHGPQFVLERNLKALIVLKTCQDGELGPRSARLNNADNKLLSSFCPTTQAARPRKAPSPQSRHRTGAAPSGDRATADASRNRTNAQPAPPFGRLDEERETTGGALGGPPTGDSAKSGVFLAEALNGLVKRVRQLEHDNARLKKRQRKHREALRELRSLVAQHQHAPPHSDQPRLEQKADRCRPATAAVIPHQPYCPQASSPVVISDRVVLQQFPFLRDYDMRGRPFVGADPGKPTLVSYFAGPLQARHMFVNPQLCRLVGHSQEDLLFSKPRTFMILVPDKTWQLHRLLFGTGEPMGVSDIVWQRAEMMQRTGHMVDAHIRAQFFYGPTGQEGACDDEEQHQEKLELYCDQLKQRAELEWRQFRDASHITPAARSIFASEQLHKDCK